MYCKSFIRSLMLSFSAVSMAACLAPTANAVVIADWQFNDGALLVDSSGNDNTLVVVGGTVGNTGGNAVFSGAGWLQTASDLDLTGYCSLTVSYGVDITTPAGDYPMIFEQSSPFFANPGAIVTHWGPGDGTTGPFAGMSWYKSGTINYNLASYTASQAAEYVMVIDLGKNLIAPEEMTQVYIDGVLSSENGGNSLDDTISFATGLFNIGARADASLNIAGTMSYFKIEGVPLMPGDADRNGLVDSNDAAILADNWLKDAEATWAEGDFNKDGMVNDIDATLLAANWQTGAAMAGVPEPGIFVLLAGGLIGLICQRRSRRG